MTDEYVNNIIDYLRKEGRSEKHIYEVLSKREKVYNEPCTGA